MLKLLAYERNLTKVYFICTKWITDIEDCGERILSKHYNLLTNFDLGLRQIYDLEARKTKKNITR